jgi:hypothetical protein
VQQPHYRHTQFGWVIAGGTVVGLAMATVLAVSLSAATIAATRWMIVALFGVLAAAFVLLGTLTVEVDGDGVRLRFGIGLVRRSVPAADIVRCEIVRTPVWWGWGLHWTPSGWLYNVSGREAVRIDVRRERAVIVGSDDAPALKQAIDRLLNGAPQGAR